MILNFREAVVTYSEVKMRHVRYKRLKFLTVPGLVQFEVLVVLMEKAGQVVAQVGMQPDGSVG